MRGAFGILLLLMPAAGFAIPQLPSQAEHRAIAYSTAEPTDAIAQLQQRIDAGATTLAFDPERGYLPALLEHLQIPVSSQGLVFSKTSLQLDRIAPWSPRALYFNDDVYVGWVQQGPILEIASIDPNLGTVFYSLPQQPADKPEFRRETTTCLVCHDSASVTGGVPGVIVRSMYTDKYGYGISAIGNSLTTDRSPLAERWGGWYVTGTHASQTHAGNVMAPVQAHETGNLKHYLSKVNFGAGGNITDLKDRFDTTPYLTRHSDIVALLVFAHQASMHNAITRASYDARTGRESGAEEALVRIMLFVKEAALSGEIRGTSSFAADFASRGPRDRHGRSLRQLDLQRRLFKYPLSFLIYSEQFTALPSSVKDHVYRRLNQVLNGDDTHPDFAHLSAQDRAAILEILNDTKPDFVAANTSRAASDAAAAAR